MRYLFFALIVAFATSSAFADDSKGTPKVINGYTMEINNTKVYLWGVNGPNKDEYCLSTKGKRFTCGAAAERTLRVLLQSKSPECKEMGKADDNTPLVQCSIDRFDVADQLVLNGWAVAKTDETDRYSYSEKTAKITKSGMWKSLTFKPNQILGRNK
ncbi:MAG: thermonuclease family protein [Alphaproteobacteria bacterium]|nr:thermonuclease family protein [Rhodospirillales bacterium]MCW9046149.1 thermonuclease family protein [Alphaproteobacteria bacterium]